MSRSRVLQTVVRLMERPNPVIIPGQTLVVSKEEVNLDAAAIEDGGVIVKNMWLSIDPAMRGWMSSDPNSYIPPVGLGDVMRGGTVGQVIASKNDRYRKGQLVQGMLGWQEYATVADPKAMAMGALHLPDGLPPQAGLNVLGMTGMTAYFGLMDVGQPKAGETVVVTGAAGATGSLVAQIAKAQGCRVVGIAGGPDKCDWLLKEVGVDAAVDYKAGELRKQLKAACPKGVDVFFDNVGGNQLDTVLGLINLKARVVICGAISQYNEDKPVGPKNYLALLVKRARMEGFIVFDYASRYKEGAIELGKLMQAGKVVYKEDVREGLESATQGLLDLFEGKNRGKTLIHIADAEPESKL